MNKDIMICGVGGQGTVLASKIIAAAAMDEGNTVHSAETIGMAQRGGSVTSHVRVGEEIYSPLIPFANADIILAFEPAEAVRNLVYLKKDGMVIVNSDPTKPVTESLQNTGYDGKEMIEYLKKKCNCIVVSSEKIYEKFGSSKFFNIAILGVAVGSGRLGISEEAVKAQIEKRIPVKFLEANMEAFKMGIELSK
ncbi:MAG: indolepyruvate oxidoreductase subunit beta [Lachnospiraceae bacterium]|nr:indolepyruvate oxidoreductase subunit beta [Lachnospiraceae bacterium]